MGNNNENLKEKEKEFIIKADKRIKTLKARAESAKFAIKEANEALELAIQYKEAGLNEIRLFDEAKKALESADTPEAKLAANAIMKEAKLVAKDRKQLNKKAKRAASDAKYLEKYDAKHARYAERDKEKSAKKLAKSGKDISELGERQVYVEKEPNIIHGAFRAIRRGDWGVRLSAVFMGAGYLFKRQYIKALIVTGYQVAIIAFIIQGLTKHVVDFITLGTVEMKYVFNPVTMKNEMNDFDNSFTILLMSIITFCAIALYIFSWFMNMKSVYGLMKLKLGRKRINNFKEDVNSYINEKFHITLLSLPVAGVVIFTVVPLIILIAVAFTNYDQTHMPPTNLFDWVGFKNFEGLKNLFTSSTAAQTNLVGAFGYSFRKVLIWTLVWAFFATFSNYFLGIMFAKFLLNKKTKCPKFWRTIFVVTIAVPQFVTLLIIRNFLADQGIVNTIMATDFGNIGMDLLGKFNQFTYDIGIMTPENTASIAKGIHDMVGDSDLLTWCANGLCKLGENSALDVLKKCHLVKDYMGYVPFLSDPNWAKVMVIIINIWVGVPYQMLIATGVLLNIPADMTESAKIDGANSWQSFWRITMPYMFAVTGPTLITDIVRNINNFNVIFLLTQDVYYETDQALAFAKAKEIDLLVTWLFRLTQESYNYKMASVIGIIVFVVCAAFTLVAFRALTRGDKESEFQ